VKLPGPEAKQKGGGPETASSKNEVAKVQTKNNTLCSLRRSEKVLRKDEGEENSLITKTETQRKTGTQK